MLNQRNLIVLSISLTIIGGAFAYGVHKGTVWEIEKYQKEKIHLQNEILDLNADLQLMNAEMLRLNRLREELVNELEKQALEANGADNPGIGTTGGLYRLERRWGDHSTTP